MRLLIALLLVVMSLPSVAMAQVPVPAETAAPADASIDELIRIIENDDTRAVLLERLRHTATGETATPVETAPDLSIARQLAEYTRRSAMWPSAC